MKADWIVRTHRGDLHVPMQNAASVPPHVLATFHHACAVFAFLIERGERVTPLDWCERIEQRYAPHHRRARVTAAIKACLLDAPPVVLPRPSALTCCCCGNLTSGRQWWNRDTGYGICKRCADDEIGADCPQASAYGTRGVHFDINQSEEV